MLPIELRQFLANHQPLPADAPQELMDEFQGVLYQLFQQPDEECIPLLFGTLGEWEELTVYDSLQSVLRQFDPAKVIPHLRTGLLQTNQTLATWCADTARYFPDPSLLPGLEHLLASPGAYTRLVAAAAVERIGGDSATRLAAAALPGEEDEDVKEILEAVLDGDNYY